MAFVSEVFDASMALMDELSASGEARTADTEDYKHRTPDILNLLTAEYCGLTGERFAAVEEFEDYLAGVPEGYARSAMCYGLAANLLVDENPSAAVFYQQRYEELRDSFVRRVPAEFESVIDAYGIRNEHGDFSRW